MATCSHWSTKVAVRNRSPGRGKDGLLNDESVITLLLVMSVLTGCASFGTTGYSAQGCFCRRPRQSKGPEGFKRRCICSLL
jgi:hypothetical protein